MSASVEFTAPCFRATLSVTKNSDGSWSTSLHRLAGPRQRFRSIALNAGEPGQLPRVQEGGPSHWDGPTVLLGTCEFDIPRSLVPKLQAFLAEHALPSAVLTGNADLAANHPVVFGIDLANGPDMSVEIGRRADGTFYEVTQEKHHG